MTSPGDVVPAGIAGDEEDRPAAPRIDAVVVLTVYLVTLFAIPSRFIVGPLGGIGAPATILSFGCFLWWCYYRLGQQRTSSWVVQPTRRMLLLWVVAVLASYVAAMARPISGDEAASADRGVLVIAGWVGIFMLAADGISTRERLDTLLRRISIAGGAVAALGIVQFWTHQSWTGYLRLPGLTESGGFSGVIGRDGFTRPAGTALHPIEYGVVLTVVLPIALHYALQDRHRSTLRRWWPVAAIAMAIPISVSRTAFLCTAVVLAFLIPTWPARLRRRAYVAILGLMVVIFVTVPGMMGTILGLFTGIGNDSSADSRTGSYSLAWEFVERAPIFGRGYATFLPEYRILDNQYLLSLIDTGFFGMLSLVAFFLSGILVARRVRRLSTDPGTRQLAQSLAAGIAAGAGSYALFDALSFPMQAGLLFLVIGSATALYRIEAVERSRTAGQTLSSPHGSGPPPRAPAEPQ
jgi:O-antigen ligase